jgi:O-antigen ligase
MWPLGIVLLVATHFAMPGTLGTFRAALFPQGGLIKQQQSSKGSCSSGGRLTDLGPSFAAAAQKPLFGYGYGTRIVDGEHPNACILDDQWLGTLLENGTAAIVGWLWLFLRVARRLGRAARDDDSARGWLLVALCASLIGCSVGMLTFDAFSFIQVNFLIFILLAFSSIALAQRPAQPHGQ